MDDTLSQLRNGQLAGTRRLDLSCGLTEFPREVFALADSLEILNLSGNALHGLPHDLHRLHRLRVLFCSDNRFTELPEAVGRCERLEMVGFKANQVRHVPAAALPPALRWLILTDNDIGTLPESLGTCTRLQKLMLAGNRLARLPDSVAACERLELLRLAANRFTRLPDWLPTLPRLAWLACAGNPVSDTHEVAALAGQALPSIEWSRLALEHRLGEGASGVIHRALWQDAPGGPQAVALKRFKGAMTSDGLPHSEMAACIAAGAHPQLIGAVARIAGMPDGADGLALRLVDPGFEVLAGPPSLASCTRDIYAAELRLPLDVALRMALGIASAAAHLHARGVLHGDLYAHNILWNGRGECLLGDFGAASFFDPADRPHAHALQRIEARAFGCLLEELIARCDPAGDVQSSAVDAMAALRDRCLDTDAAARPLLADIRDTLAGCSATNRA